MFSFCDRSMNRQYIFNCSLWSPASEIRWGNRRRYYSDRIRELQLLTAKGIITFRMDLNNSTVKIARKTFPTINVTVRLMDKSSTGGTHLLPQTVLLLLKDLSHQCESCGSEEVCPGISQDEIKGGLSWPRISYNMKVSWFREIWVYLDKASEGTSKAIDFEGGARSLKEGT